MKKLIFALILTIVLVACTKSPDLPPSPPPIGTQTLLGKAIYTTTDFPWAGPTRNIASETTPLVAKYGDQIFLQVINKDQPSATKFLVYDKIYILKSTAPETWEAIDVHLYSGLQPFSLDSRFEEFDAMYYIPVDPAKFDSTGTGANYFIYYWCAKQTDGTWECNNDATGTPRWTLGTFTINSTKTPTCGDWVKTTPETCEDGNTLNGDGCDSNCTLETATGTGLTITNCAGTTITADITNNCATGVTVASQPVVTDCATTTPTTVTFSPLVTTDSTRVFINGQPLTGAATTQVTGQAINTTTTGTNTDMIVVLIAATGIIAITLINFIIKHEE